jgi:hypothetical protein
MNLRPLIQIFVSAIVSLAVATGACAQAPPSDDADPARALSAALSAACRADQSQFEKYLTVESANGFRSLSAEQRAAFLKRFSLSDEGGKPLVSATGPQNRIVLRCVSPAYSPEFRFGDQRVHDNLAFIRVSVVDSQDTTFGLVREDGAWRLLSLGLVMLDVPQLAGQWMEADLASREAAVVSTLRSLANAIQTYRRAYGKLPDTLAQLGPAAKGQISPDLADLVDEKVAGGDVGGYSVRYRVTSSTDGYSSDGNGFELAATPRDYGRVGRQSFFLDAAGKMHGADKHGQMAAASDLEVVIAPQAPPSDLSEAPAAR